MTDQNISLLYDHYKDTCSITGNSVKRRDRLMIFVVTVLGFFAIQAVSPVMSSVAVNDFLNFKFGLTFTLNLFAIESIFWFLLLILSIRYFQVAVFIERQYNYLHRMEDIINKKLGEDLIVREGKSYLNKYPLFSDWTWFLYTVVFPILLLFISIVKISTELSRLCVTGWSFGLILNSLIFVLLSVSIVLYLIMVHKKNKK